MLQQPTLQSKKSRVFVFATECIRHGVFLTDDNKLQIYPEHCHYQGYQAFLMQRKLSVPAWDNEETRPRLQSACKFSDKVCNDLLNVVCFDILSFEKRSGTHVMLNTFTAGQRIGNMLEVHSSSDGFIMLSLLTGNRPLKPACLQYFCNNFVLE